MASLGHEAFLQGPFVQPASFLRPRGLSQPMTPAVPESALERDQRIGLVSCSACPCNAIRNPSNFISPHARPQARQSLAHSLLTSECTATHPRIPQSPHELRRPTPEFPIDHLRYLVAGQEKSEHPDPEW